MRGQAHRYHGMILPLIKRAVEPGSEMQVYLLEEALDLWSAILSQSEAPASAELIELADCAFPLLEIGSDNLRTVLSVVESYVLLAPHAMVSSFFTLDRCRRLHFNCFTPREALKCPDALVSTLPSYLYFPHY